MVKIEENGFTAVLFFDVNLRCLPKTIVLCENDGSKERRKPMLHENIKNLRKSRGMTQEELASRLHIVRQTVSKWEKGYSVPDAEMLRKLADALETDTSSLLGETAEENTDAVAEQLSRINAQLAIRNRRSRRIWKTVGIILAIILIVQVLSCSAGIIAFDQYSAETEAYTEEIIESRP